jgi:3-oxoadipate enol-lactonase
MTRRSRRAPRSTGSAPLPPIPLPPGRAVTVPERGEFFLRDTGGDGPAVLLVHGWMFPSDLNWLHAYGRLARAGYRVLAMDLRGHGRGLRSDAPFRLEDCADDAAGVLAQIGVRSATVVGYSMGGPVASLIARRHPDRVDGIVLCATALDWSDPRQKVFWRTMGGLRLVLGLFRRGPGGRACAWPARRRPTAPGWRRSCRGGAPATSPRPDASSAGSTAAGGSASCSSRPRSSS